MIERRMKDFISAADGESVMSCEGLKVEGHLVRAYPDDNLNKSIVPGWVPWVLYKFIIARIEVRVGEEWFKVFSSKEDAREAIQQALSCVDEEAVVCLPSLKEVQKDEGFEPELGESGA